LALGPRRAGHDRLQPPADLLGARERELFVEVVDSLPDNHFAQEDLRLLVLYVQAVARAEQANKAIVGGSMHEFWLRLHSASVRSAALMATKLRIGAKARDPSSRRRQGNAIRPHGRWPWEGNPGMQPRAVARDSGSERNFADLLRAHDRGRGFSPPPRSTAA